MLKNIDIHSAIGQHLNLFLWSTKSVWIGTRSTFLRWHFLSTHFFFSGGTFLRRHFLTTCLLLRWHLSFSRSTFFRWHFFTTLLPFGRHLSLSRSGLIRIRLSSSIGIFFFNFLKFLSIIIYNLSDLLLNIAGQLINLVVKLCIFRTLHLLNTSFS